MMMFTLPALAILATLAAPTEVRVHLLGGSSLEGSLTEVGAEQLKLETADGPASVELPQVAWISPKTQPAPAAEAAIRVDLVDGSSVAAGGIGLDDGKVKLTLPDEQTVELSLRDLTAIRLQPWSEALQTEWSRLLEGEVRTDLLVVRKGNSLDFHHGTLRGITATNVPFEIDGETLAVKREKVFGIICSQSTGRNLPEAVCHVIDGTGSTWDVRSMTLDGDQLTWTTPLGLQRTRPLASIAKIDYSEGKVLYLSDLKPESSEWTPYLGKRSDLPSRATYFGPRSDQGLRSGPMEVDGKVYAKGLALHSRTTLVYRLPGRFHRFKAIAGIDDRVRPHGNVRLIIRGDDQTLKEITIAGNQASEAIDMDLNGVRRLTILVDFGEDSDVADHLDLCEARVLK
jgi:hypothetical protein